MKPQQAREMLAREAARIMAEEGRRDYLTAKRKAAERLRLAPKHLPTNREVSLALAEHERLFEAAAQSGRMARLREAAVAAMDLFGEFESRAAGALTGETATAFARVELHLFVDPPETVALRLNDLAISCQEAERRMRWGDGRCRSVPLFAFALRGQPIEVLVFTATELREAPTDPASGRPMQRLSRRALVAPASRQPSASSILIEP